MEELSNTEPPTSSSFVVQPDAMQEPVVPPETCSACAEGLSQSCDAQLLALLEGIDEATRTQIRALFHARDAAIEALERQAEEVTTNMPALIAEIERLRAQLAQQEHPVQEKAHRRRNGTSNGVPPAAETVPAPKKQIAVPEPTPEHVAPTATSLTVEQMKDRIAALKKRLGQ